MKKTSLTSLLPPNHQLIGHRGVPKHAPENTLASFKLAADRGLNWVEFDVRLTKDDALVIFHDASLERTSNGQGLVSDHTLIDLKKTDAGNWFSAEFKNEKIPTLIEAIPLLIKWGLTPNIEIKCEENQGTELSKKIAQTLASCLQKHWPKFHPLPLVSSFDFHALAYYRAKFPLRRPPPIGFLVEAPTKEQIALVQNTPNSALHCSQRVTTPEQVSEIVHLKKITVLVYTINNKQQAERYLTSGAFAVFTDDPFIFISPKFVENEQY